MTLRTYQEIRSRIYTLAREHGLRPDWIENTRSVRLLLLYDAEQIVVGRAMVPLRDLRPETIAALSHALEHVFGKDWLE
ncbi:hypothetical protein [Streptosporangium subroseum]|uniref:hypothetical protein n=1 Tax=Streptosporangium subroseum TaxID=106412 RepID=UPI00308E9DF3|nr:hypothetical protein OHB15_38130 [Streptosporangium subroseum]